METFGPPVFLRDGYQNLISSLGTTKDVRSGSSFVFSPINQAVLETMYRSDWVARAIVEAPADDMTREWRSWQAAANQIEAIEDLEKKLEIQKKFRLGVIRARLYGGAALVMGVSQGQPEDELDLDAVGKDDLKYVAVLNRYDLAPSQRILDISSRWYGRPEFYTLGASVNNALVVKSTPVAGGGSSTVSSGEMVRIHPSRVIELAGNELPDWPLSSNSIGWGDSVLQTVDEPLKDFWLAIGGLAGMMSDMKLDVISVEGLSEKLGDSKGEAKLLSRFMLANLAKSTTNSLLIDKTETWQRIQTSFAGASDVVRLLMTNVCASGRVPESILMRSAPGKGLAAAGSSGGEIDVKNYFDDIASEQKTRNTPLLEPLDRCIVQSALGSPDSGIYYEWNPLYQPDPAQVAAIALQKAQTTAVYWNLPEFMNPDALRRATINQLQEDGTYPGLEDAIEEFGEAPEMPEPDEVPDPPPGMLPKGQFEPNPFEIMKAQKQIEGGGAQ